MFVSCENDADTIVFGRDFTFVVGTAPNEEKGGFSVAFALSGIDCEITFGEYRTLKFAELQVQRFLMRYQEYVENFDRSGCCRFVFPARG